MKSHFIIAVAISGMCLINCQANADMFVLSGNMDVFQATTNPGNTGNGAGIILGDYDDVTNVLNYNLTWANLTTAITNAHFHVGAPGVAGPVDLGIPGPWNSPYINSAVLTAGQETNLLSGNWYVNIHTTMFPSGEIRGQVGVAAAVPEPGTAILGLFGLAGICLRRRRSV